MPKFYTINPTALPTLCVVPDADFGITAISDPTGSAVTSGGVSFANGNGVTFGLAGSTMSASIAGTASINVSAGTTSNLLSAITFADSNNVSFGLNASTVTASYAFNVSAGTTSNNLSQVSFANGSGVSFGLNAGTLTASVAAGATATGNLGGIAAAGVTDTSGTVIFSNSNNVSFGLNGQTMTGSAIINVFAGVQGNNLSVLSFANGSGVSFGLNGSTITGSVAAGATATGNLGGIAAAGATATSGTVIFSNSNNMTFGLNGQTMTGSFAFNVSAGTTSNNLSQVSFANGSNVSFGLNAGTLTASVATSLTNIRVSAGTTSNLLSAITFADGSNVSFGINASTITASVATSLTNIRVSAGTTSNLLSAITFSNSNNVSFGINASTITASIGTTGTFFDNVNYGQSSNSNLLGGLVVNDKHGTMWVIPLHGNAGDLFPFYITASTAMINFFLQNAAGISNAHTSKIFLGIYTANVKTLSLLNTVSVSWGSNANNANISSAIAGYRWITIDNSAWSSSPAFAQGSKYYLGYFASTAGTSINGQLIGQQVFDPTARSGTMSVNGFNTTNGPSPWMGQYTATTTAFPTSIGTAELNKATAPAGFCPEIVFVADTASTIF